MTKHEFAEVVTWLAVAIGKPIAETEDEQRVRIGVYYECLGDVPIQALRIAARRCAMERKYQSFPPIAELRELATDTMRGEVKALTGAEAFGIALRACNNTDIEVDGSRDRAFAKVPTMVKVALERFGFMQMYNLRTDDMGTARAQFTKIFDAIDEREKKTGLLPLPVQEAIAKIGEERETPPILEAARKAIAGKIGAA